MQNLNNEIGQRRYSGRPLYIFNIFFSCSITIIVLINRFVFVFLEFIMGYDDL